MSGRPVLVLSSMDVWDISSQIPVPQLLKAIQSALLSFSRNSADTQAPHRTTISSEGFTTLFMPSRIDSLPTTCIKVVAVPKHAGQGGLPATTLVMDEVTGGLDAIVNARTLTALRTAAASTLATTLSLGPGAKPTHLLLFGAGAQIHAHAAVLIATYPSIRRCTVVNRSYNGRLITLLDHFRAQFPGVEIVGLTGSAVSDGNQHNADIEQAVKSSSIICTATSSTIPLFPCDWVVPGTHLNLIGSFTPDMAEVDSDLIRKANLVIVDSRAACAKEAGEFIVAGYPFEKAIELGELEGEVTIASEGGEKPITIFKSVGVSVMDAAITHLVVQKARESGKGVFVPYDWMC